MERDFLGVNNVIRPKLELELESPPPLPPPPPQVLLPLRSSPAAVLNSATYGNTASKWHFTSKEQPQHFLSFARRQEGQLSKFPPSGFQTVPTSQRADVLVSNQLDRSQSTPQYATETRVPFVNERPSGSTSSSLSPRNGPCVGLYQARKDGPRQFPSQLTIFYCGSVSVFDNVPLDKVKEIMSIADKASSTPCTPNPTSERPTKHFTKSASFSGGMVVSSKPKLTQKPDHVFEPVMLPPPPVSTQISLSPTGPAGSSSISAITNENLTTGTMSDTPSVMVSTPAPNAPRAVPQARKASLARFLEKRKERVLTSMPYPSTAKSADALPSKSSSTDITLSSNNDDFSPAGLPKIKSSTDQEHPCTRLEI